MEPTLNSSIIGDDQMISTLLDHSILNVVDLTTGWPEQFNLELFSQEEISSLLEDVAPPQEPADFDGFQNNSDDSSTEIYINPPATLTLDNPLTSPNVAVIHNITDSQSFVQEKSSSWEEDLVLQPFSHVSENLNDNAIDSPASLTIDEQLSEILNDNAINTPASPSIDNPHTSSNINNTSLDSPELFESPNTTINIKKRKSDGKPSGNILKKKLKISPPSDEVAIPTTSTPSVPTITRKTKNKKNSKEPT